MNEGSIENDNDNDYLLKLANILVFLKGQTDLISSELDVNDEADPQKTKELIQRIGMGLESAMEITLAEQIKLQGDPLNDFDDEEEDVQESEKFGIF